MTRKQKAQLMVTNYIEYLKMSIKEKEEKRNKLDGEIAELKEELREKEGYKRLKELGIDY